MYRKRSDIFCENYNINIRDCSISKHCIQSDRMHWGNQFPQKIVQIIGTEQLCVNLLII